MVWSLDESSEGLLVRAAKLSMDIPAKTEATKRLIIRKMFLNLAVITVQEEMRTVCRSSMYIYFADDRCHSNHYVSTIMESGSGYLAGWAVGWTEPTIVFNYRHSTLPTLQVSGFFMAYPSQRSRMKLRF